MEGEQYLERRFSTCYVSRADLGLDDVEENSGEPIWDDLMLHENITSDTVSILREFDEDTSLGSTELLTRDDQNGYAFVNAVSVVFKEVTNVKTLLLCLKMTEDFLLHDVNMRLCYFEQRGPNEELISVEDVVPRPKYAVGPFIRLINHSNAKVVGKALYLSSLMFSRCPQPRNLVMVVLDYTVEALESGARQNGRKEEELSAAVLTLTVLLRNVEIRSDFAQTQGVKHLQGLLRTNMRNMANLYNVVLCLWLAAFDSNVRRTFQAPELSLLISLVRTEPFEKIIRVSMAIIRLVLANDTERQGELSATLIGLGVLKLVDSLEAKKAIKDEDLLEDLRWVRTTLQENFRVLTTFERHQQELLTKRLTWSSTVHTDAFWKENAIKFEHENFDSVKKLIALLSSSDDTTAAIACFDLGQFVQYYPKGKLIVDQLGGKKGAMKLLQHENVEVQKQALKTCSKIMINNWDQLAL